jgi:dipeptidase E
MKKLLLTSSSDFFYKHIGNHVNKPLDQVKIAWVTTAKKGATSSEYMEKHYKQMDAMPFEYEEIDIEGKDQDELRKLFSDKDVVYMHGGNTFYLMRAIKDSGFQEVIEELIGNGVLYAGTSAGAYVACPSLEMCLWKDTTKYFPFQDQDLEGMGLVPFIVSVHYEKEHKETTDDGVAKTDLKTYVLTDDQALIIEDGQITELTI